MEINIQVTMANEQHVSSQVNTDDTQLDFTTCFALLLEKPSVQCPLVVNLYTGHSQFKGVSQAGDYLY